MTALTQAYALLPLAAAGFAEMSDEDYQQIDAAVIGFSLQLVGGVLLALIAVIAIEKIGLERRIGVRTLLLYLAATCVAMALLRVGNSFGVG